MAELFTGRISVRFMFKRFRIKAGVFLLFAALSFTSCDSRTAELQKQGNHLIHLIEAYRLRKGEAPTSLSALGIEETESGPLYYQRLDSATYEIWFGTSLGESKRYSSLTKKWGR